LGILLTLVLPTQARAQVNLPSKEAIAELAGKADREVAAFETAVNEAKPWLDKLDPELATSYFSAASTAHTTVQDIQKNGASAYLLVGLLAAMEDVSLDAANGSVQLMAAYAGGISIGLRPDATILGIIMRLSSSGDACSESAESILHTALVLIEAEEQLLAKTLGGAK
jgi:hypothetical protein